MRKLLPMAILLVLVSSLAQGQELRSGFSEPRKREHILLARGDVAIAPEATRPDSGVSALDALVVINDLNVPAKPTQPDASRSAPDALLVINDLNVPAHAGGAGNHRLNIVGKSADHGSASVLLPDRRKAR